MPVFWGDLETTGLELDSDQILEVGYAFTDDGLNPIFGPEHSVFSDLVFPTHVTLDRLRNMNAEATEMHAASGLLADILAISRGDKYGETLSRVEENILARMDEAEQYVEVTERYKWTFGGSGPHFDRNFVERYMPTLFKRIGYRFLDVSQLRTFFTKVVGVNIYDNALGMTHRADVDILDHINEYTAYADETAKRFGVTRSQAVSHLASVA